MGKNSCLLLLETRLRALRVDQTLKMWAVNQDKEVKEAKISRTIFSVDFYE